MQTSVSIIFEISTIFLTDIYGSFMTILNFKQKSEGLRLSSLKSFLTHRDNQLAQSFFRDLIDIRHTGYCNAYPKGFVPVDTTDFVAELYLIHQGDRVISCLRQLPLSTLNFHKLNCPLFETVNESGTVQHKEFLKSFISECEKEQTEIIYSSRFTIDPAVTERNTRTTIKEIMAAITYRDQIKAKTITITGCVPKYNTDKTFSKWGYEFVKKNNEELGDFQKNSAGGEKIKLMYMLEGSSYGKECFEKHQEIFQQEKIISENHQRLSASN